MGDVLFQGVRLPLQLLVERVLRGGVEQWRSIPQSLR